MHPTGGGLSAKIYRTHFPDLPGSIFLPKSAVFSPHFSNLWRENRTFSGFFEGEGSKKCVQTNFALCLAIFGHFGVFCALLRILVKTWSLWGAPTWRRQMGNREYPDPKRPPQTRAYLCPPSFQLSKHGPTGAHLSPLGVLVTATTRLQVPLKTTLFYQNTPKCTKYAKIAKHGQT